MKLGNWALLCLSIMFSGCAVVSSSDVNPSTIYSQYSASYDEAANKLKFDASFFVGGETGTYVELSDKSSVTIRSQSMVKNKTIINQIIYESEMLADTQTLFSQYEFTYTNDVGSVYRNAVQIPGRVSITAPQSNSISMAAGLSVIWQSTTALTTHESVQATLNGSSIIATESSWSGGQNGQISFSPQELKDFKPGTVTLTVCRQSYTTDVQGPAAGGSMSVSYCATPVSLTLTQ